MKTYEEMSESALRRIKEYKAEKKRKTDIVFKKVLPAGCLCLAAVIGFGIWQSGTLPKEPEYPDTENEPYSSAENAESVYYNIDINADTVEDFCHFRWQNKFIMLGDLYWKLEEAPEERYAIKASYKPAMESIGSFVYEGKPLSEWAFGAYSESGEVIEEGMVKYKEAYNACLQKVMPERAKEFSKNGIEFKQEGNTFIFSANAEELAGIELENIADWLFGLAES